MIKNPHPKMILSYKVLLLNHINISYQSLLLIHICLYNRIHPYLFAAIFHDRLQVSFIQLNNLFGLVNVHKIGPLHVPWIMISIDSNLHSFIIIELPIYSNGCIIAKNVQIFFQIFHKISTTAVVGWKATTCIPALGIVFTAGSRLIKLLLLLLNISLNAGDTTCIIVLLDDVN